MLRIADGISLKALLRIFSNNNKGWKLPSRYLGEFDLAGYAMSEDLICTMCEMSSNPLINFTTSVRKLATVSTFTIIVI